MTLATRCPTCGTAFRVVQDQLKVSDGWVRCGRCASVFNATESLFDLDAVTAPAPPPSPVVAAPAASIARALPAEPPAPAVAVVAATPITAAGGLAAAAAPAVRPDVDLDAAWGEPAPAPALSVDELHAALFGTAATADAAAAPAVGTLPAADTPPSTDGTPGTTPAPPLTDAAPPPDASARDEGPTWDVAALETPSGFDADEAAPSATDRLDELVIEPVAEPVYEAAYAPVDEPIHGPIHEPIHEQAHEPVHEAAGETGAVAEAVDEAAEPAPDEAGASTPALEEPPAATDATPAAPDVAGTTAEAPAGTPTPASAAAPAADEAPAFLREAERAARWRAPEVRAALAAAVFLLSSAGVLQATRAFHAPVAAQWPGAQSWLAPLCRLAGCEPAARRRIDGLSVESSSLVKVDGSESMRLSLVLRNRDRGPLWLPAIELTLSDTQGGIVARKVLRAAELGATADTLDAGAELPLQALLDTGEQRVVGYTIELFYP